MDLLQKYTEADRFYELDEAVIETIDSLSPVNATESYNRFKNVFLY